MPVKKPEPKWLSPKELKAWRAYIVASRRLWEALETDLAPHQLSMSDYEILVHLSEAPDRQIRMSELAMGAMISKSRLSHRMKVMEKEGWVRRELCKADKRGQFAIMTEKGWKAMVKAAPDHISSVRERFIDHLTAKDQEDLARIFERVSAKFREDFGASCEEE
jgi:DNA-binding MarR family transcriptional regulator